MYGTDRSVLRRVFTTAWAKYRNNNALAPLESQIVAIIAQHPEYHTLLDDEDSALNLDTAGQMNPFLHLALHLAIAEQLASDRPVGLRMLYQRLTQQLDNPHAVEHEIIACLSQQLRLAQTRQTPPDEQAYIGCIEKLLSR